MRIAYSTSSQQEISCILVRCDNIVPMQKSGSMQLKCQHRSFQHSSLQRHRFLAFFGCFLSKTYRNEYRMNKDGHIGFDIEAT